MASSSSFVNESNIEYDVFLSFKGETRYNFTSHLYNALKEANIKVFRDESLEKGKELMHALHKVIDGAKISVVVLSSEYASSTFCLEELAKIIECMKSKGQTVLPIFYKVFPSNIRKLKQTFEEAFAVHEAKFRKEKVKVQRWKYALRLAGHLTGWHVDDKSDEVETIRKITHCVLDKLNCAPTRKKSKGVELLTIPLAGEFTAIPNFEEAWKCLMDDKISRVGIHGMGGIGKTTIATHINNRLIETDSFQHVYWVTVSKESSNYKLQSDISKAINLDLSREEDEKKRAAELWGVLNNMKRFVLILDDMWKSFELKEVGIPISATRGKLLLTSREHRVCKEMKCEGIVKIEPLLEREARGLFIRESGHKIDDNPPQLRDIIASVIKECDGLPLAIKVIAKTTIGFTESYEWSNILEELRKPSDRQNHDMEEGVFKVLKFSYDRLKDDKRRQCLHYCAMYPEDYSIHRDNLIEYCIAGGVINELDSRQEEFNLVNTIINELIDASLLERKYRNVKMHDVIRDMVLALTRGKLLVKAGLQLKDLPKFSDWSANLEGISIMNNYKMEGCSCNSAPNCHKLRILLMQKTEKLSELPDCFFVHMQNLTILDMSHLNSLKLLPNSISKLETLRMLNVEGCTSLEYVPCLVALKDLRYLNLSWTKLHNLPEGMEKLVNMKVLCFIYLDVLSTLILSEVLKELSLLQELDLFGSNIEVDPNALSNLKKLKKLRVKFKNFETLNSYLESRHWQELESYSITCKGYEYEPENEYGKTLSWCKDIDWDSASRSRGNSDLVIPFNLEQWFLKNWDSPLDGVVINGGFAYLKHLTLEKCKLNYLVSIAFPKQLFENLEYLSVGDCAYIEEIIRTEESFNQSNLENFPTIKLPKLESLHLKKLPRLRSIYRGNIELPSLQYLKIDWCKNLERLPFRERPEEMGGSNIDSKLWWDSLQWDDQNHKQVFEEYIPETLIEFSDSEPETERETGGLDLTLNL